MKVIATYTIRIQTGDLADDESIQAARDALAADGAQRRVRALGAYLGAVAREHVAVEVTTEGGDG